MMMIRMEFGMHSFTSITAGQTVYFVFVFLLQHLLDSSSLKSNLRVKWPLSPESARLQSCLWRDEHFVWWLSILERLTFTHVFWATTVACIIQCKARAAETSIDQQFPKGIGYSNLQYVAVTCVSINTEIAWYNMITCTSQPMRVSINGGTPK